MQGKPYFPFVGAAVLAMVALSALAPVRAAPNPGDGTLRYTVLRDGDPIGTHAFRFRKDGDAVEVAVTTDIAVKMAFITLYRFRHDAHETWRGGRLVGLKSETDDDGTEHSLVVTAAGDGLQVVGDGDRRRVPKTIIPASLWNPDIVRDGKSVVLNTLDGTTMKITVEDLGPETVTVENSPVEARHYAVKGDLERELWYDADGRLVKLRFEGDDGSDIQYVLK